jgi:hypothetical protein
MTHFYSPSDVSITKISVAAVARVKAAAAYVHYSSYVDYYCGYLQVYYCEFNESNHKINLRLQLDLSPFKVLL